MLARGCHLSSKLAKSCTAHHTKSRLSEKGATPMGDQTRLSYEIHSAGPARFVYEDKLIRLIEGQMIYSEEVGRFDKVVEEGAAWRRRQHQNKSRAIVSVAINE